jgi:hypothetical protein
MVVIPIFATLEPLERIGIFTPLGIRFWDLAGDAPITDGLDVTARPPGLPELARRAFQTASGVYAFRNLPGLRSLEFSDPSLPAGAHPIESSPPELHPFIVEVSDRLGRFLPVNFQVDLPHRGIFPAQPPPGSGAPSIPGFYLFSSPSRRALSGLAIVRAQLVELLGPGQIQPASFGVLEVETNGGPPWLGMADETGSVAAIFPYPAFASEAGPFSPPPGPPETRLQAWDVTIRVRYRRSAQVLPDNRARFPDLGSILTQPPAQILTSEAGPALPSLAGRLVFGQEMVLKTSSRSDLLVQ